MPRIDHELDIAVEKMEEADELAQALPRVGRVEQPIQRKLRAGRRFPARNLRALARRVPDGLSGRR